MSSTTKYNTLFSIHTWSQTAWTSLEEARSSENKKSFNDVMLQAIPELEKYVESRLKIAIHKKGIPKGKYQVADFINDLFIAAYDEFLKFSTSSDFSNWLYMKMDELIEDQIIEEKFDDFFFNDFGNLSEKEWDDLKQKATIESEPTLIEGELSKSNERLLASVFKSDTDQKQLAELHEKVGPKAINEHLDLVKYYLPTQEQLVLHLIDYHLVDPKNVAFIHNKSEVNLAKELEESKKRIKSSFVSRYGNIVF